MSVGRDPTHLQEKKKKLSHHLRRQKKGGSRPTLFGWVEHIRLNIDTVGQKSGSHEQQSVGHKEGSLRKKRVENPLSLVGLEHLLSVINGPMFEPVWAEEESFFFFFSKPP